MVKGVLDIGFLMEQFGENFLINRKNVEALINFARKSGMEIDLWDDAVDRAVGDIGEELTHKVDMIKNMQSQLTELQNEEYKLSAKKKKLEDFVKAVRETGALEEFYEDPF